MDRAFTKGPLVLANLFQTLEFLRLFTKDLNFSSFYDRKGLYERVGNSKPVKPRIISGFEKIQHPLCFRARVQVK